jgi:hypothetical protein
MEAPGRLRRAINPGTGTGIRDTSRYLARVRREPATASGDPGARIPIGSLESGKSYLLKRNGFN